MTKIELAATIGRWISEKGVLVTHTQEQVKAKIEWVTNSMKEAFDWENSVTGAGVRESQGPIRFRATILAKCAFYFYLKEVFVARAGINPKCNSSELGLCSSSSESEVDINDNADAAKGGSDILGKSDDNDFPYEVGKGGSSATTPPVSRKKSSTDAHEAPRCLLDSS